MKIHKLIAIFSFALVLFVQTATGQIITDDKPQPAERPQRHMEDKIWKWDRFYFGGFPSFGIGGGGGNNGLSISAGLSAEAGYFVHERIALGVRTSYLFGSAKYGNNSSWKYHLIGGSPYVRGYIWKGLFVQGEYQFTNFLNKINDPTLNADFTLRNNSLLLGGGYHDGFEDGFGYYVAILFNVVNTGYYPYPNPDFRIGITYRLPTRN
ncbi:hypothetical protein BH09BAC1_BH09BAC1_18720 [soil metagenome]